MSKSLQGRLTTSTTCGLLTVTAYNSHRIGKQFFCLKLVLGSRKLNSLGYYLSMSWAVCTYFLSHLYNSAVPCLEVYFHSPAVHFRTTLTFVSFI